MFNSKANFFQKQCVPESDYLPEIPRTSLCNITALTANFE